MSPGIRWAFQQRSNQDPNLALINARGTYVTSTSIEENGPVVRSHSTNYCRRARVQVRDLHVEYEWSLADECTG